MRSKLLKPTPIQKEALELYVRWHNLFADDEGAKITYDELLPLSRVVFHSSKDCVAIIDADIGDEGGPARLTVHWSKYAVPPNLPRIDAITMTFDLSTRLIYTCEMMYGLLSNPLTYNRYFYAGQKPVNPDTDIPTLNSAPRRFK